METHKLFFNTVNDSGEDFQRLLLREGKTAQEYQQEVADRLEAWTAEYQELLSHTALMLNKEYLIFIGCTVEESREALNNALFDIEWELFGKGWERFHTTSLREDPDWSEKIFLQEVTTVAAIYASNQNSMD